MTARDRGYGDHDDYTTTPDAARGAAGRHALIDADDPRMPTKAELDAEARQERRSHGRRWSR